MKKIKGIVLFLLIFFIVWSFTTVKSSNINEYEQKKQEAINIIASTNPIEEKNKTDELYVFITKDSSKFHLAGCDYLDGRPIKVTLEWAESNGYGSCPHCNPHDLNNNYWLGTNIVITFIIIIIIFIILGIILVNKHKMRANL